MRRSFAVLSAMVFMAVTIALPIRAQTVADFDYCTDISILNNTGSAITDAPVRAGINTLNYVTAGLLNASATDMELYNLAGTAIVDMTAQDVLINDSSDWIHVDTLADGAGTTDTLCSGSTTFTTRDNGFGLYGAAENITVPDDATLDLTDEYTLDVTDVVFYNIGNDEAPLMRKAGAYELGVKSTNTVYARVIDSVTTATGAGTPTAGGEGATGVNLAGSGCVGGAQESCVNTNDGDTSYVYSNTASGFVNSYFTLTSTGLPDGAVISSVTGTARGRCVGVGGSFNVKVGVRIGADESEQTIAFNATTYATTTTAAITAPGGGSWEDITVAGLEGGQIKLAIDNTASCAVGTDNRVTWVYLTITYYNAVTATFSPIAVDTEYDIAMQVLPGTLVVSVDGVEGTTQVTSFLGRTTSNDLLIGGGFTGNVERQYIATINAGGMFGGLPTYELAEYCLDADATTVTLTLSAYTIPTWARHLIVAFDAKTDLAGVNDSMWLTFNNDGSAIYNTQKLYGAGAGTVGARTDSQTTLDVGYVAGAGATAGVRGAGIVLVPEYANTARQKTFLAETGNGEGIINLATGRAAMTAAITSLEFSSAWGTNITDGSCFTVGVIDERYSVYANTLTAAATLSTTGLGAYTGQLTGIGLLRSDTAGVRTTFNVELNGDTTSGNYNGQIIRGEATSVSASAVNNFAGDITATAAPATEFSPYFMSVSQFGTGSNDPHLLGFSGLHESTTPVARVDLVSTRWNNTAAITQVTWDPAGDFEIGSSMWLYTSPQTLIERVTVGAGGVASISFDSIPSNREALSLNLYARGDTAATTTGVNVQLNGDTTAANYNMQLIDGDGSTITASQSSASQQLMEIPAASAGANIFGGGIASFNQYAGTTYQKAMLIIEGAAEDRVGARSMRWEDTSAINSIVLTPAAGNFDNLTVAELWGLDPQAPINYVVDFTYEADEITQTDAGDGGDGWTWEGTVTDQSANANNGTYNLVRDTTGITVNVGPAVAASSLTPTDPAAEVDPSLVSGDPNPGFADPYAEGTTASSFAWPLSIIANINTGVTDGYPLQLLGWSLAVIVGLLVAFGAYRATKIIAWTIIASVAATSLVIFMTPIANVIILLMVGTAVVTLFLIPRSWETQ